MHHAPDTHTHNAYAPPPLPYEPTYGTASHLVLLRMLLEEVGVELFELGQHVRQLALVLRVLRLRGRKRETGTHQASMGSEE